MRSFVRILAAGLFLAPFASALAQAPANANGAEFEEPLERARRAAEERERLAPATPEDFRRDLEEMAALQRRLRILELRIREAEAEARLRALAAPPEQPVERRERAEERERREVEERRREAETTALVAVATPRVVMVAGSGADARAVVLVPFLGEQVVAVGDKVGDWEILAIDRRGVEARRDGGAPTRLAFGRSVPALPPFQFQERSAPVQPGAAAGQAAPVAVPVPVAPAQPAAAPQPAPQQQRGR